MAHLSFMRRAIIPIVALALAGPLSALERVTLDPIDHAAASLTVDGANGSRTFSPAELEELGAMRLVTTTPWRTEPAAFDGVLLQDVLEMMGLSSAAGIRIIAENDYAVDMPREIWEATPILIATRVDGQPHTRRHRGPIQFVMPFDAYVGNSDMREGYWVWMAARIEPME